MDNYLIDEKIIGMLLQVDDNRARDEFSKFIQQESIIRSSLTNNLLTDNSIPKDRIDKYFQAAAENLEYTGRVEQLIDEVENNAIDIANAGDSLSQPPHNLPEEFPEIAKLIDQKFLDSVELAVNNFRKGYYDYASYRLSDEEKQALDEYLDQVEGEAQVQIDQYLSDAQIVTEDESGNQEIIFGNQNDENVSEGGGGGSEVGEEEGGSKGEIKPTSENTMAIDVNSILAVSGETETNMNGSHTGDESSDQVINSISNLDEDMGNPSTNPVVDNAGSSASENHPDNPSVDNIENGSGNNVVFPSVNNSGNLERPRVSSIMHSGDQKPPEVTQPDSQGSQGSTQGNQNSAENSQQNLQIQQAPQVPPASQSLQTSQVPQVSRSPQVSQVSQGSQPSPAPQESQRTQPSPAPEAPELSTNTNSTPSPQPPQPIDTYPNV